MHRTKGLSQVVMMQTIETMIDNLQLATTVGYVMS